MFLPVFVFFFFFFPFINSYGKDLWSAYQTIQENMLKGGISGRSAKGKRIHTRAIHSIDTDIKLNRALWVMAETLLESMR